MDSAGEKELLLRAIERGQLGYGTTFQGPYGTKKVLYADYTASGRPLGFIEDYLQDEVASCYGNTHTTTSYTSRLTTGFREEARFIIRNALNCTERDALIFTGSGCTAAVHKLVYCLQLERLDPPSVIFVSTFEHHSNLLPWRELQGVEVICVPETEHGELDYDYLEDKLKLYHGSGRKLIGAFNAASNITGVLTDTDPISVLMHKYGGLVFWDYAAAAPYVKIDMNPSHMAYKDAVYFSVHKFIGGPDSPGILAVKKDVLQNTIPHVPGGGTVLFVTKGKHRYHEEAEVREEGGTPAILGSIRAGLAFQLKEAVGCDYIMAREEKLCRQAFSEWESVRELKIVGPHSIPRLPIFSFLIHHPASGLYLHHYFVCVLLNDLFGIQARGGCSCAGPYGQALLNIPEKEAMKYVLEDSNQRNSRHSERELLKPGMSRLSFTYFMSDDAVDYIIKAVAMVAKHGWKLLPQYTLDPESGLFSHIYHSQEERSLSSISYREGHMTYSKTTYQPAISFQEQLQYAQEVFDRATSSDEVTFDHLPVLSKAVEDIRWFLMPNEAHQYLTGKLETPITKCQLNVKEYVPKVKVHLNNLHCTCGMKACFIKKTSHGRTVHILPSYDDSHNTKLNRIKSISLRNLDNVTMETSSIKIVSKGWQSTDDLNLVGKIGCSRGKTSVSQKHKKSRIKALKHFFRWK